MVRRYTLLLSLSSSYRALGNVAAHQDVSGSAGLLTKRTPTDASGPDDEQACLGEFLANRVDGPDWRGEVGILFDMTDNGEERPAPGFELLDGLWYIYVSGQSDGSTGLSL